jgi:hypothetical protein
MDDLGASGPWRLLRLLVLDPSPVHPRWLIATIALDTDVRPARLNAHGRYQDWPEVAEWARRAVGQPMSLVPLPAALAWQVGSSDGRRPG